MKAPNGWLSGDGSSQSRRHGGHSGALTPNFFVLRKICFKHMIKTKNFSPQKCIFPPQTLKPGYVPVSDKIVFAIRIFCFEGHSASRCSITSETFFYKSLLGGPCKHFGGSPELGCYMLELIHQPDTMQNLVKLCYSSSFQMFVAFLNPPQVKNHGTVIRFRNYHQF